MNKKKTEKASIECKIEENGEVSIEINGTGMPMAIIMIESLKELQHDGIPVVDIAMIACLAAKDEDYYSIVKEYYHEYAQNGLSIASAIKLELLKYAAKYKFEEENKEWKRGI